MSRAGTMLLLIIALSFSVTACDKSESEPEEVILYIDSDTSGTVLFHEPFEDNDWESRGWYDDPDMKLSSHEKFPGGERSCVWHWKSKGDISPDGRGARVELPPLSSVTLSFYMKHGADWTWTGVDWHPHEFHFVTTEDDKFIGPAYSHLTFYIEVVNGVPRVAIQDGKNVDESRVGQNLVGVSEERAVAGCNGDSDGHGGGDCYPVGDVHRNGKFWDTDEVYFSDTKGPHYKNYWHHVKVTFRLNSIENGIGLADGVIEYWYDGQLIIDHDDVVFRTGQHPDMKINQFLMTPYYGPGVPHEQKIWVDELRITTDES